MRWSACCYRADEKMSPFNSRAIADLYGCGHLTAAPGTVGSAAALLAAIPIVALGGTALLAALLVAAIVVAYVSIGKVLKNQDDDPPWIVVDELCGQWLALLAVGAEPWQWAAAFVLFRLLDIFKPMPINLLERHLKGAAAVIADDLAAGAIAAIIILLIGNYLGGYV